MMKSGILSIHKPEGISSARVVALVKKALKAKKVGHTGTLAPFATGLLLCAINKGTRISRFFLDGHKQYTATVRLGVETDTYDKTGQVVSTADPGEVLRFTENQIKEVVDSFLGVQQQEPPSFSALKHEGQPLYKLARQGVSIKKPARTIEIFDIGITRFDLPDIDIIVSCSSGTYIRSIAYDIGKKLGCGAHLTHLCRTTSCQFELESSLDMQELETMDKEVIEQRIISLSNALSFLPKAVACSRVADKIKYGQKLAKDDLPDDLPCEDNMVAADPTIRVVDEENSLLALVQFNEKKRAYDYSCVFAS